MRTAGLFIISLAAMASAAVAQIPTASIDELDNSIGARVLTSVVLSTADGINTGAYKWSLNSATGDISRLTWDFDFTDEKPLGDTGLEYMWTSNGGVGYADYSDFYSTGALSGNDTHFQSLALGENVAPRIFFTDDISVLPSIGGIYGYTRNELQAGNPAGRNLLSASSSPVDWNVQTFTTTPGFQVQYQRFFGPLRVRIRSNYNYYWTSPITQSTDAISFRGSADAWENLVDLDYNTGLQVLKCDLHAGATFTRDDLFGDLQQAVNTDHYYTIGARLTLDTKAHLPFVAKLGPGVTYTFGHGFHGYSAGLVIGIYF
jgi:solitary outer membrane autotransporter-like beta-barrel protein